MFVAYDVRIRWFSNEIGCSLYSNRISDGKQNPSCVFPHLKWPDCTPAQGWNYKQGYDDENTK